MTRNPDRKQRHVVGVAEAILTLLLFVATLIVLPCCQAQRPQLGPKDGVIATAVNSDPGGVPTIGAWMYSKEVLFVYATFPSVPGARLDASVFESYHAYLTPFLSVEVPGQDTIEIRHRYLKHPQIVHVLTVKAKPGEVEFSGSLELDQDSENANASLPDSLWAPDLCCQLMYGEAFQAYAPEIPRNSAAHAEDFYDFVKRCFIFTEKGQTFLDNTVRNEFASTVGWDQNDPRNNPPITQRYLGAWQGKPPEWMKYVSPDRYVIPILGAESRDGKHLMAVAGVSPEYMQQALFECLHSYARWLPEDAPLLERVWKRKLYVMENNPDLLREKVRKDFPNVEVYDE